MIEGILKRVTQFPTQFFLVAIGLLLFLPFIGSVHLFDWDEINFALEFNPNYIAFGPIFETKTKKLEFAPQGIKLLKEVVQKVKIPVVAIGGINFDNCRLVIETGVNSIAMISALECLSIEQINQNLSKIK